MSDQLLDHLKERLEKARDVMKSVLSIKDLQVKDSDLIKFNKHGQWTLTKEEEPYWSLKSKFAQQKKNRELDRQTKTPNTSAGANRVSPSVKNIKYVNVVGGGRTPNKI